MITAVIRCAVPLALLALTASPVGSARAQTAEQRIAAGHRLADQQCSQCHRTTAGGPAGWTDVPSFAVIANRPGTTTAHLLEVIETPQDGMLHTGRSPVDAQVLAAYIMSLRGKSP
jgi:mono/diheme cytochrome c family protein